MADPWEKSKRRSIGNSVRPLKNFTIYLDEGFDCPEVKGALVKAGIKFISHFDRFPSGMEDEAIFARIGRKGWVRLTLDRQNRHRDLERQNILDHKVRQFVFTANLGGVALGKLVVSCYPHIRQFCHRHGKPLVATVTKSGQIVLRMDCTGKPLPLRP
jgi:hypothetical protein